MTHGAGLRGGTGGLSITSMTKKKNADSSHQNRVGKDYVPRIWTPFLFRDATIVLRTKQASRAAVTIPWQLQR